MDKNSLLNSGLIKSYVLGLCSGPERQWVEEWAQKDEEVACMLKSTRLQLSRYCRSRIRSELGACKGHKSLNHLSSNPSHPQKFSKQIFFSGFRKALTGLTIIGLFVFFAVFGFKSYINEVTFQISKRFLGPALIANQSDQSVPEALWFTENAQTIPVLLSGSNQYMDAHGTFYWNPYNNRAFMQVGLLPTPPDGKCFHLWADMTGRIVNLGRIEQMTKEPRVIPALNEKFKLNLTLENAGRVSVLNENGIVLSGGLH